MKTIPLPIFATRQLWALALALFLFESRAFATSSIDLIVIAEQAAPAAKIATPSPEHPVYYLAYDAGFIEAGEPIAGIQSPSPSAVEQALHSAVNSAGYAIATGQNEPSIVLVYHYGSLRPIARKKSGSTIDFNLEARVNLITTTEMARQTFHFISYGSRSNAGFVTTNIQDSLNLIQDPRYYFIVVAYDYADLCRQKPTELWRVKLSAEERGNALEDVVPQLAAASQPYLGANFPDRQHASIPASAARDRARPAPTANAPIPFPRRAVEQIDPRFMRALLLHERAAITNSDPSTSAKSNAAKSAGSPAAVIKANGSIEAIVVAERTIAGAAANLPKTNNPVYYVAVHGGYLDSGDPITGIESSTAGKISHELHAALASADYSIATTQQPPSLLLVYAYGLLDAPSPSQYKFAGPSPMPGGMHGAQEADAKGIHALITTTAERSQESFRPFIGQPAKEFPQLSRAFVTVSAYDFSDFTQGKVTLRWSLKLSTLRTSGNLDDILPALASAGGPFFGRNFKAEQTVFCPVTPKSIRDGQSSDPPLLLPPEIEKSLDATFLSKYLHRERAAIFWGSAIPNIDETFDPPVLAAGSSFPPALAHRIAQYQTEKDALQAALTTKLQTTDPGPNTRNAIDAFNRDNAERISQLGQTREDIRSQLATLAAARPNSSVKSLDNLLLEFAAEVQRMEPAANAPAP